MHPQRSYMIAQPRIAHLPAVPVDSALGEGAPAARGPRRCWMAVAAVLVGAGWGSHQFTPMLLVYRHRRRG